jgi:hypothetical protein
MKAELHGALPAILTSHSLPEDEGGPLWEDRFPGFPPMASGPGSRKRSLLSRNRPTNRNRA